MQASVAILRPPRPISDIATYLERHRAELGSLLDEPSSSGATFARRHSKIMDGLLTTLFPLALAGIRPATRDVPVVFGAVGGYGRGLLGWKSDLDVRLVTTDPPERTQELVEGILYPLWDARVSIGHQVITLDDAIEAARDDLPTATSLLDFRTLAGDAALGRLLEQRAFAGPFSEGELPRFMERLEAEVAGRHRRFGDSVYLLEPDVKSGAGGLRDLDIALWAARARYGTSGIADMLRAGVLVTREADELLAASDFLWSLRNHLHRHANRRSDRLTFEEQETIARDLGYGRLVGADPGATADQISGAAVEMLMSDYYRHARVISRARERIVARATPHVGRRRPHQEDLGGGIATFDGQLTLSEGSQLGSEPALVFRVYATALQRGMRVSAYTRDVVSRAASDPAFAASLRESREASALFVALTCSVQESRFRGGSILGELHDVGLLTAMIPEFTPVVGRVHHDVYHVYTVDVHSVAAVDRLRALARGDLAGDQPLASRLAAEVSRPEVLYLATLLHDVGKAIGGRDHSVRGAHMAKEILERLGLGADAIAEACHLILQHLAMYHVAVRRDLEDPATLAEFAHEVHGREGLRDLFLLTVADLSTTSPTSMTKWKSRMLNELYLATDAHLSGANPTSSDAAARVRALVKEHWTEGGDALSQYLDSMPERYLLANEPEEIAVHARVALSGTATTVNAALVPSRHPDVAELCVVTGDGPSRTGLCIVTGDRPGLLAAITAAIASNGLEVHAAQIHTRELPSGGVQAVDLFWIAGRVEGASEVERALPKLQEDLRRVVSGAVAPKDLVGKRGGNRWSERPSPAVLTEVLVDNRASAIHTVVEVVTRDHPGLLYTLAQALHALDLTITVAKINTEGTRVADVFYVTELDGRKLVGESRVAEVRAGLFAALKTAPPTLQ